VGLLAVIVGPSLSLLARNVSRKPHLFAGSEVAVCRPLQLGFETCFEVHAFLKAHEVPFYTLDDLNHDRETLRQLGV
jgi:hypothetical protein